MSEAYPRAAVLQGNQLKRELEEFPTIPAMVNGDVDPLTTQSLAAKNNVRKAGPGGVHAVNLMVNPEAIAATENWMNLFGQSNQGMEFNQAKMIQAQDIAMANATDQMRGA